MDGWFLIGFHVGKDTLRFSNIANPENPPFESMYFLFKSWRFSSNRYVCENRRVPFFHMEILWPISPSSCLLLNSSTTPRSKQEPHGATGAWASPSWFRWDPIFPYPKHPFVCPKISGLHLDTFLFFSDGIGTLTNTIRSGGVDRILRVTKWPAKGRNKLGGGSHQPATYLRELMVGRCDFLLGFSIVNIFRGLVSERVTRRTHG